MVIRLVISSFRLPPKMKLDIKRACKRQRIGESEWVRQVIAKALDEQGITRKIEPLYDDTDDESR